MFMTWNVIAFSVTILNHNVSSHLWFARYYDVLIAGVKQERSTNMRDHERPEAGIHFIVDNR